MSKKSEMENTGERFVPESRGDIVLEHLHRYRLACELIGGKVVLDIASGEGYGSAMMADFAGKVIGVDISEEAILHAGRRYEKHNLEFRAGSCAAIPLPDASVDTVVSFETIEHHDQHVQMMQEIKRVLRPDGLLVISSPDKYHYSIKPEYKNEYHVKELFEHEFKQLLNDYFENIEYFGQRIIYGSCILAEVSATPILSYCRENEEIRKAAGLMDPLYWIALASNAELPVLASSVFDQPADAAERNAAIDELKATIAKYQVQADEFDNQLSNTQRQAERVLAERDTQISALQATLKGYEQQAAAMLSERDALVDKLVEDYESQAKAMLAEREGTIRQAVQEALEPYRAQADEFVKQLSNVQAQAEAVIAERDATIHAYRAQAEEFVRQLEYAKAQTEQTATERDRLQELISSKSALIRQLFQSGERKEI